MQISHCLAHTLARRTRRTPVDEGLIVIYGRMQKIRLNEAAGFERYK